MPSKKRSNKRVAKRTAQQPSAPARATSETVRDREGAYRNYIKSERMAAGFPTQLEFARHAGIEASWFTRIENGRALAAPEELDAIANALGGIPLTRLYDEPFLAAIGAARRAAAQGARRVQAQPV